MNFISTFINTYIFKIQKEVSFQNYYLDKSIYYILTVITILIFSSNSWGSEHILTESMGENIYPTSFSPQAIPGDTIIIDKDRKSNIKFNNFLGTENKQFIFTNPKDAKVTIRSGANNAINFFNCRNFILTGNNYELETYGIEIDGSADIKVGVRLWQCADWEIAFIYIHNTSGGITQNNNDLPNAPWTESDSIGDCRVHHCKIADTNGEYSEGMYFGKTKVGDHPKWNTLEIDNCLIYRTGSDGIQAGQTRTWLKIHDNYVEDPGIRNDFYHNFGIIINFEAIGAEIFNNTVVRARHSGIQVHSSSGAVYIHHNDILNAGYENIANGIKINTTSGISKIINNSIAESNGYGIKTDSGTAGEIRSNLLIKNKSGAIKSTYTNVSNNIIINENSYEYNNTSDSYGVENIYYSESSQIPINILPTPNNVKAFAY